METRPFLVNGEWRTGEGTFEVTSPYDDSVVAEIGVPTAADVEEATAVAAETFETSQHLPVHVRSEALDHISRRLAETIDENAALIAREGGKPLKWATVEATRAVSTFRWASETIRARRRRADASGHRGGSRVADRADPPVPGRARPGDHAVQLPAEPGGAQGRARARGRGADRRQARLVDADRFAAAGGVLRGDGPAQGHVPGAAGPLEGRRRHGARRAVPQDLVHGVRGHRVVPEGPGSEEARHAGAGRQRGRDRALRRGPGSCGGADRVRRVLPGRSELHQRAARPGGERGVRGLHRPAREAGREPEGRRPDGPDGRRRPGDRQGRGRPDQGMGRRGRLPGRRGPRGRHRRRPDLPADAPGSM